MMPENVRALWRELSTTKPPPKGEPTLIDVDLFSDVGAWLRGESLDCRDHDVSDAGYVNYLFAGHAISPRGPI